MDFRAKHRRQVSQCPRPLHYYIHWTDCPCPGATLKCSETHMGSSYVHFKPHTKVMYVQNFKINTSNRGQLVVDKSQHRGPTPRWHHSWLGIEEFTARRWGKYTTACCNGIKIESLISFKPNTWYHLRQEVSRCLAQRKCSVNDSWR